MSQSTDRRNDPPRGDSQGAVGFLWHYVTLHPWGHLVVLFAVLSAVGCAIGSQYAVKTLVDTLGSASPYGFAVWHAVGVLLALVAGDNLLWRLAGWVASSVFVAVAGDLRLDLFQHLSGHGARYFSDQFPGALAGRIATAATATWTIESSLAWMAIPPAAAVVSSILLLSVIDWQMTAALVAAVTVVAAVIARQAWRTQPLHRNYAGCSAGVTGNLADVVSNMGLVRTFGTRHREQDRLAGDIGREMSAQRQSLRALEKLRLFHAISVFGITAALLTWSVSLWRAGLVTTGEVVLTTTLGFTVLHASRDLAMASVELVQNFARLGEAVQVLMQPHEMTDSPNARTLIDLGSTVSFVNVCFAYPNSESVLQDFNLHIPSGQRVGMVGRSGAGKSTIFMLLQRFYDPDRGHVLIDEQDIAEVTQDSLRRAISVVHQDISLFHRSLLDNLRYGRPDATDNEILSAADAAHCTEFIQRLPDGFQTIVGERGLKLSGGQRQRLAIARAFLRDAPIVLLDEATSALDSDSERSIQEALVKLMRGRTVLAIAHRLSSLDAFDRIIVLDRGRIVEDGPPAELLRRQGNYWRLYQHQLSAARRS